MELFKHLAAGSDRSLLLRVRSWDPRCRPGMTPSKNVIYDKNVTYGTGRAGAAPLS
jgi:hypothetical protein